MTKGGLAAVARSLAIEYAARGVRVNAVSLGVIKTPMHNPSEYDAMAAVHPLGGDASSWRVHRGRHFGWAATPIFGYCKAGFEDREVARYEGHRSAQ
jgi:NAD(P)-dependent dehydrogenase (short-subunit alcohol dehydrogenase family)